ncbi:MAG: ECF transporter S component [Lachnospiraceae bacterium]|nr:ECF transporter S component [Lachnospiraceae bacterium]
MVVIKNSVIRNIIRIGVPFLLMPAVVAVGVFVFDDKSYAFVSLAVALLSCVLFVAGFEKKRTGTGRMALVAVLVALTVTGRFIPYFKPVAALTVITGMYLGGEAGFLVGAMAAVISNFYFGQGPWTPFQMLAWGMIGFIAGLFCDILKRGKLPLIIYGVFSGIFFSFVMDVWTVLWYNRTFDGSMYLAAIVTALPYTVIYAVSNVFFLLILKKPIGGKLERICLKYRL